MTVEVSQDTYVHTVGILLRAWFYITRVGWESLQSQNLAKTPLMGHWEAKQVETTRSQGRVGR